MQRYNAAYSALYDIFTNLNGFGRIPPKLARTLRDVAGALPSGARIFDFGCGTGKLTAAFLSIFGGGRVKAVDPSDAMLGEFAGKFADNRNISHAVGGYDEKTGLAEKSGEYDVVMSAGVLEHIRITRRLASEFMRVMKPGGYLAVTYERNDGAQPVQVLDDGGSKFYLHANDHVRKTFENAGGKILCQFNTIGYLRFSEIDFRTRFLPRLTRYAIMVVQKPV